MKQKDIFPFYVAMIAIKTRKENFDKKEQNIWFGVEPRFEAFVWEPCHSFMACNCLAAFVW